MGSDSPVHQNGVAPSRGLLYIHVNALIIQGALQLNQGAHGDAFATFGEATKSLRWSMDLAPQIGVFTLIEPNDLSSCRFYSPVYQPCYPGPHYTELKAFRHALIPAPSPYMTQTCDTTRNDISLLAVWTMSSVYNMALCNHLSGRPDRMREAVRQYKDVWSLLLRTTTAIHGTFHENHIILILALSMNLCDCLAGLGELDESYLWMSILQDLVRGCMASGRSETLNDPCFPIFRVAAGIYSRSIAAGAA